MLKLRKQHNCCIHYNAEAKKTAQLANYNIKTEFYLKLSKLNMCDIVLPKSMFNITLPLAWEKCESIVIYPEQTILHTRMRTGTLMTLHLRPTRIILIL